MDKNQAQKIIKDTFEKKFDKFRFKRFIINLLNIKSSIISDLGITFNTNQIPNNYQPFIDSFEKIAEYKSGEHKMDVLSVKLKKETSIERARTMQRNFIAWYLRGDCGGEMKDSALAAFISPDENDWRFSLIKMDYSLGEDKKGRIKISEKFTPAKRWSFLVGSNEKSHTAQSQLIGILKNDELNPTLANLEEAFNVEKVTKEFFEKYRYLFLKTKETLDDTLSKDSKVKSDFEAKNINTVDFSKKLIGQIVFLYFLQKKGWFGAARDADWGTGPKNFLRELFEGKHCRYKNFFNDILEPLFYNALRIDRSANDDYHDKFNCKIPFLNGGLFDPIGDYSWVHTDINLPDELFSNKILTKEGDKGTGILDVFDRYNFTVKEDEPLEKEVAVDPEMLGKVFENLLEVKDRKTKGTYYTPREIVHYMCQQSLINYLATELDGKVSKDDIEILFKYGEQFGENNADLSDSLEDIPVSINKNVELIDKKFINIKVCDPAVGSGAFLVGIMSEIVRIRNILSNYINDSSRTIYNFKRECIENSLYGVDIDPGAVEIAKLRLWLSLVVNEEDIKKIKPLPNLDYKIVCGNSLLGVDINLFNYKLFGELEKYKAYLFNETNPNKKQEYKNHIDNLINKITNGHREFDFEIHFSEIFHKKKGFDIVIANPPYVNIEKIDKKIKKCIDNYKTAYQKYDLYVLFYEKGINLLKDGGVLTYISSNKFLSQGYGFLLRKFFLKYQIKRIINFNYNIFESATVRTCIFQLLKKDPVENKIGIIDINNIRDSSKFISGMYKYLDQEIFSGTDENNFRINLSTTKIDLINKIKTDSVRVDNICSVNYGLRPSSEKMNLRKEAFIKKDNPLGIYKKYFEGKDMGYWSIKHYLFLDYRPDVMYNPMFNELFEFEKIVGLRTLSDITKLRFIYDNQGYYCNDSVIVLTLWYRFENIKYQTINRNISEEKIKLSKNYSLKYLQSILNSKIIKFYVNELLYDGTHFYPNHIKQLPIKKIIFDKQAPFICLVDKILAITKDEDYLENSEKQAKVKEYERQIDHLVYELYNLTPDEIDIIEGKA